MADQLRELLRLDFEQVDLRKGLTGLVSIMAFGLFVARFGTVGIVAAFAALFVIIADQPGSLRARANGILVITVLGAIIALVGVWAGPEHVVVAAALTFVVVLLATIAAGFGANAATQGVLLSIWAVVAISLAGEQETALELAAAYAGGGAIAAVIIYVRTRAVPEPSIVAEAEATARTLGQVLRSPLGWFALLRASAAGLALWLGAQLFPDHVIWAALTVILVMRSKAGEAVVVGLLRTGGTVLGVVAAEVLIAVSDGETVVVLVGFIAAGFGMAALQKVNYAVFVACLTALLVLADELAMGTGEATAADRLLATILGAGIAFAGIAIGRVLARRPVVRAQPDPRTDDPSADRTPG